MLKGREWKIVTGRNQTLPNSKFPPRWRFRLGAYRYRPHPAQRHLWDGKAEYTLGKTEAEAWRTWFERTGAAGHDEVRTMHDVFDAFWKHYVLIQLKPSTQESYVHHIARLRPVFGHMRPEAIKPSHAYQYRAKRADVARVAANREVSVLTSALTFAVEQGWIDTNPLRGQISRRGAAAEQPRKRVPTFDELSRFCEINPKLKGYVALKLACGLRKGQMLAINLNDHWDGQVLHPPTSKGGTDTRYEGADAVMKMILAGRVPAGPLFANNKGEHQTITGFNSKWQRAMAKFIKSGGTRFNEHDIRKTVANAADSLLHAQRLLGHRDQRTTATSYRIGRPETVATLPSRLD